MEGVCSGNRWMWYEIIIGIEVRFGRDLVEGVGYSIEGRVVFSFRGVY